MDASFPEFLLLFVIGLIVLGPERMSQVAKKIGEFVGYARRMSGNLQRQLEDELEMNRIRESLPKKVDLKAQLGIDEIERDLKSIADDVEGRSDTAKVDDSASADDERDARASDGPGHAYTGADDAIDPEDLTFAREADGLDHSDAGADDDIDPEDVQYAREAEGLDHSDAGADDDEFDPEDLKYAREAEGLDHSDAGADDDELPVPQHNAGASRHS